MKLNNPGFFSILVGMAMLNSCTSKTVDTTQSAPQPQPVAAQPAPAPQPVRDLDGWRDWPVAQGNWHYAPDTIGSLARFVAPDGTVRAMFRCDRGAATVFVSLAGTGSGSPPMELRTTSGNNSFATRVAPGSESFVYATIPAGDPMLDNIAYSRGKFLIAADGLIPLTLPAWPETGRVIEDCR